MTSNSSESEVESLRAIALGRWLDGSASLPDELDEDVIEAIYALRPQLAPAPRVTIEDILAHLDQADALAAHLDGGAAGGIDADALEAIHAFKPQLAPGPRVSIDDILARVKSGPLAEGESIIDPVSEKSGAEVVPFPRSFPDYEQSEQGRTPVSMPQPVGIRNASANNSRWYGWLAGTGLTGVLVAAALALAVLPTLMTGAGAPTTPTLDVAGVPAAEPPPVFDRERAQTDGDLRDEHRADNEIAPPAEAPAAARPSVPKSPTAAPTSPGADQPLLTAEPGLIPEARQEQATAVFGDDKAEGTYWSTTPPVDAGAAGGSTTGSTFGGVTVTDPAPTAPVTTSTAPATELAARGAEADSLDDQDRSDPDALARQGRYHEAAAALEPSISGSTSSAQKAAAKVTRWYTLAGEPSLAIAAAERGIGMGGGKAPADLWRAYADALDAVGRTSDAAAARAAAH